MIECGSEGASVVDSRDVREIIRSKSNWDYYDESLDKISDDHAFVTGCFGENSEIKPLADLLKSYLGREAELSVSLCDSADWENEWKKYYSPLDFGSIVVVPEWLDGKYDKPKILIDPGMAFGTGTHHTTRMCLELLEKNIKNGDLVADLGCGSGILSIAASLMGAKETYAIDIDPVAARVAAENAELNGIDMPGYFIRIGDILSDEKFRDDISGRQYDIVLANIVANVIIAFAPVIPQLMKPDGKLIASGIIADRLDEVLDALKANGLEAVEICSGEDWRAVLAAKIS